MRLSTAAMVINRVIIIVVMLSTSAQGAVVGEVVRVGFPAVGGLASRLTLAQPELPDFSAATFSALFARLRRRYGEANLI